tara:strand:- start:14 stop:784 length:771 start_codon:yes stop_codon:yes gene_type:complete
MKSTYGPLAGTIFQYFNNQVAFLSTPSLSNSSPPTSCCILLGGLSDGLLPTPYTLPLQTCCHENNIAFCNPLTSSSYLGFGYNSLTSDCAELLELISCLQTNNEISKFYVVGHSTGCQQAVSLLQMIDSDSTPNNIISGAVLQAAVSDREGYHDLPNLPNFLETANQLVNSNKGDEFMPRNSMWSPITANRFLSLYSKHGQDDMFSSDLTPDELSSKLSHLSRFENVAFVHSGSDEYVPSHISRPLLYSKLQAAGE